VDRWKYYDITHRDHLYCNPLSATKVDELITLLGLRADDPVVDIACGKAELLIRLAERYAISGIGVDISPYCVRDARAEAERRSVAARVRFVEQDGATFEAAPHSFALAICLGASWIHGGHRGTLRALAHLVRPGGQILVGEPFWLRQPDAEYLEAAAIGADDFSTHAGNVATGIEQGLSPLYTIVSNQDDWDRYEGLQWRAAEQHAAASPDHPDLPTLRARVAANRETYLRWGRDTLAWAVYLFQR
jgi:SAM-dependent methyltransferase